MWPINIWPNTNPYWPTDFWPDYAAVVPYTPSAQRTYGVTVSARVYAVAAQSRNLVVS